MSTLQLLQVRDPEDAPEPTGAKLIECEREPEADSGIAYESWTGTLYPTIESAPWQCRESLVEVKV